MDTMLHAGKQNRIHRFRSEKRRQKTLFDQAIYTIPVTQLSAWERTAQIKIQAALDRPRFLARPSPPTKPSTASTPPATAKRPNKYGRHGMSWEEQDWVDEDATAHRSMDE